jgi:ABC-type transport system involved in multi-copper enzyme maturation permease subunit
MMPLASIIGPSAPIWIVLTSLLAAGILGGAWRSRKQLGAGVVTWLFVTVLVGLVGVILWQLTRNVLFQINIWYVIGMLAMTFSGIGVFLGVVEYGLMRVLGLSRMGAIARITYYEALLQPFTIMVLVLGICAIGICARLNYFTYYEDFKMYRDVASSFIFLFSMPVMVFASTKVIDEEIENRTMLTLMSKPVSRTQVVLGKYLGVLTLVLVSVVALGAVTAACSYMRYYDDNLMDYRVVTGAPEAALALEFGNYKAFLALLPSAVLTFLQVATLGAVSVAISTRFGLAVNVTAVVLIYLGASLARYLGGAAELPGVVRGGIQFLAYLLPGLSELDINQRLVFGNISVGKDDYLPGQPAYYQVWQFVGLAFVYCVFYIGAALSVGVGLFRTRELT